MRHFYLIITLLLLQPSFSQKTFAQMYQWVDPDTGTTQLSGKPPVWYRSVEGGPRTFVFAKGKLIDDTSIQIADEERQRLRTKAFLKAEEDRARAKEKALAMAKIKAAIDENQEGDESLSEAEALLAQEENGRSEPEDVTGSDLDTTSYDLSSEEQASIEKMKALIAEWEKQRTEDARALIE